MRRIFFVIVLGSALFSAYIIAANPGSPLSVRSTGTATLGEGTKAHVKEKARQEAIRKAVEENVGLVFSSQTIMKNFEVSEDVVSSYAKLYVKSIREVSYTYDPVTETGTYEGEITIDTSSFAKMTEAQELLKAQREAPIEASVFLFDGEGKVIPDGATVKQGQRFNLMVKPSGDLHAYVVSKDSRGKLFAIFPNRQVSGHANPLKAGRSYYFPPQESPLIFSFDEHAGLETFHVVLSAAPMPDLDDLFARIQDAINSEKSSLGAIVENRIASRGFGLTAKPTQTSWGSSSNQNSKVASTLLGEVLQGNGALVKTITLNHEK